NAQTCGTCGYRFLRQDDENGDGPGRPTRQAPGLSQVRQEAKEIHGSRRAWCKDRRQGEDSRNAADVGEKTLACGGDHSESGALKVWGVWKLWKVLEVTFKTSKTCSTRYGESYDSDADLVAGRGQFGSQTGRDDHARGRFDVEDRSAGRHD